MRAAVSRSAPQQLRDVASGTRPEIQALRAIAVLAVVTYHLWPKVVRGGYAGVDIFFVISGFLITAHLLREVDRTGRISLPAFWARRARRLLPASMLVLLASVAGTLLVAPENLWQQFFKEISAAAGYFLNWLLAADSVDYLAATNVASPAQHYWSLSVEEQFYLVWPLVILLAIGVAAAVARVSRRTAIGTMLALVTVASLVTSVVLTKTDPAPAYFVTVTRAWEFGLGGLVALIPLSRLERSPRVRAILSWAGLALIALTLVRYTEATPFPGWRALVPTLGTAAVIIAGAPSARWAPTRALSVRPVQWLGDISYSLYLWHWPLIIFYKYGIDRHRDTVGSVSILLISLALAWLTKRYVEDPARRAHWLVSRRPRLTFALTAALMAVTVAICGGGWLHVQDQLVASLAKTQRLLQAHTPCLGAAAADPAHQPCVNPALNGLLLPDRAAGQSDSPLPPDKNCRAGTQTPDLQVCHLVIGRVGGIKVALIGDSHAEHWAPAAIQVARQRGWTLDSYLKGACPLSAVMRVDDSTTGNGTCAVWNRRVLAILGRDHYDLVLTSHVTDAPFVTTGNETSEQAGVRGLSQQWERIAALGTRVIAIRDTPEMRRNVPNCLSELKGDAFAQRNECGTPRKSALGVDPQVEAARLSQTPLVDLTPFFCGPDFCPAVIGSVMVYRDTGHIGGIYSQTLGPYLGRAIDAALADSPRQPEKP